MSRKEITEKDMAEIAFLSTSSDEELAYCLAVVQEAIERNFEDTLADAAKEGFRLVERLNAVIDSAGGYSIIARFENDSGDNVVTGVDQRGVIYVQKGTYEFCSALMRKLEKMSFKNPDTEPLGTTYIAKRLGLI